MAHDVIVAAVAGLVISLVVISLVVMGAERLWDGCVHVETGETGTVRWKGIAVTIYLIARIVAPIATVVGALIGLIAYFV